MVSKRSVSSIIKSSYRDMPQTSKKIADFVLNNSFVVSRSTISEIADELNVADSTVFQFAKSLGFKGYTDFKIALITDNMALPDVTEGSFTKDDPTAVTVRKVFDNNVSAIHEAISLIDGESYDKAVEILLSSKRACFFGLGGSGIEAEYAYQNFIRTDLDCFFEADADRQMLLTRRLDETDCLLLYSRSGLTPSILELASTAKAGNAKVIAVTNYPLSSLAKIADVTLTSTASYLEFDWGIIRSRITHYITDSLLVLYMLRKDNKVLQDPF